MGEGLFYFAGRKKRFDMNKDWGSRVSSLPPPSSLAAMNDNNRPSLDHLPMADDPWVILLFWQENLNSDRVKLPVPFTAIRYTGSDDLDTVLAQYASLGWDAHLFLNAPQNVRHHPPILPWTNHAPDSLEALFKRIALAIGEERTRSFRKIPFVFEADPLRLFLEQRWRIRLRLGTTVTNDNDPYHGSKPAAP